MSDNDPTKGKRKRSRPDVAVRRLRRKNCTTTTVKCGLKRLGCHANVRETLDEVAARIQHVVVEASLIANTTVIGAMERGEACPPIGDQNFWNQCLSVAGVRGDHDEPVLKASVMPCIRTACETTTFAYRRCGGINGPGTVPCVRIREGGQGGLSRRGARITTPRRRVGTR